MILDKSFIYQSSSTKQFDQIFSLQPDAVHHFVSHHRLHQRQLLEESRGGCHSPPRPTRLDVSSHSLPQVALEEDAREVKKTTSPAQGMRDVDLLDIIVNI